MPGSGGRFCERREFGAQRAGLAAHEHRQPMDGARHRRFERRDGAERRGQLRLRARGVELRAAAGIEPDLREIERGLLVRDVAARDVELLLLAAQLEVGARDFGGHDDLRVAQRCLAPRRARRCWLRGRGARGRRSRAPRTRRSRRRRAPMLARRAGQRALRRSARLGVAAAGVDASARDRTRHRAAARALPARASWRCAGRGWTRALRSRACRARRRRSSARTAPTPCSARVGGFETVELSAAFVSGAW